MLGWLAYRAVRGTVRMTAKGVGAYGGLVADLTSTPNRRPSKPVSTETYVNRGPRDVSTPDAALATEFGAHFRNELVCLRQKMISHGMDSRVRASKVPVIISEFHASTKRVVRENIDVIETLTAWVFADDLRMVRENHGTVSGYVYQTATDGTLAGELPY